MQPKPSITQSIAKGSSESETNPKSGTTTLTVQTEHLAEPGHRKPNRTNLRLVIVENDEDDLFLLKRALQKNGFLFPFVRLKDGLEAIDYFQKLQQPNFHLPDLVLMDINMPGKSGLDVLAWVREQPHLRDMPVIMLTSSGEMSDMRHSQRLGAFKFLTKRVQYDNVIFALEGFLAHLGAGSQN